MAASRQPRIAWDTPNGELIRPSDVRIECGQNSARMRQDGGQKAAKNCLGYTKKLYDAGADPGIFKSEGGGNQMAN